jgi:tripartite-type tricarboxylate transporter receptor subunit TctC
MGENMYSVMKKTLPLAAIAALGLGVTPLIAADASYFKGKTLKIVIPYGPGGTYDKYGFAFSRSIGKHIPGKPTVILQHMPGAGGAKAMGYAYNIMPKDGRNMIVPLDNLVVNKLMRPKRMKYESAKYNFLGSSNQTNIIIVARSDSGVKTVQDMKKIGLIGATSGKYSNGYIGPMLTIGLLKGKGKVVTGYKGSSASIFAIERGEAQMASFNWLAWSSKVPHWFKGERPFARALVQIGFQKDPDLPDVPLLSDLIPENMKPVVNFIASSGPLGRGLAMPPGVKPAVVKTMRKAYSAMNKDPSFSARLKKAKLRLIPTEGAAIQKIVEKVIRETSPQVIAQARKIIYGK